MSHSSLVLWSTLLYVTGESNRDADIVNWKAKWPPQGHITNHSRRQISKPAGLGSTIEEPPEDPRGQLVQIN